MSVPLPPGAYAKALQEKRSSQKRRKYLAWGIGGGLLVLVAVAVYVAYFSPALATRKVEVVGVGLLTTDQVTTAAAVELDVPLPRQDLAAIEARVAALEPVRSVDVEALWPETVRIDVVERETVYQRRLGGQVEWIDADGVPFHRTEEPTDGVPLVTTEAEDQRLLADIATVVTHLPEAVRADMVSMSVEAIDSITVKLSGKRTVEWGSADDSELKGQVLSALLSTDARAYDVSAPLHPTTVPR